MYISAFLIVKDESRCIVRCLDSLIGAVDEIVVVDTGSTDETLLILDEYKKNHQVKVFTHTWEDDFAKARNFALSKTKGTWKFSIDADEFLHPDDISELRRFCLSTDESGVPNIVADIRLLNLKNYEVVDVVSDGIMRLFKGDFYYIGKVHEHLANDEYVQGGFLKSPVRLFHDGYDPNVVNTVKKTLRNVRILRQLIQEQPNDFMNYVYIAQSCMSAGELNTAWDYIQIAEGLYTKFGVEDAIRKSYMDSIKADIISKGL